MPGADQHRLITAAAVGRLPAWERKILGGTGARLLSRACLLPDDYYDLEKGGHEKARPYMILIEGRPFHYLPGSPIEAEYQCWAVTGGERDSPRRLTRAVRSRNLNWLHASRGFSLYLSRAAECLAGNRLDEFAGFTGVLLHVLQDAGVGLHALEGVDGTDIFALDRLVAPPADRPRLLPSLVLSSMTAGEVTCPGPALLGGSVEEAAFILYSAYARTVASARRELVPIVMAEYGGREGEAEAIYARMLSRCAGLCADVTHTIFCLAFRRFPGKELKDLDKVRLSEIKPIREPRGLSRPYGFLTMLRDASLDNRGRKVPLELRVVTGGRNRKRVFRRGLGTGCHYEYTLAWELPAGVYRQFRAYAGLHATLGRGGKISVAAGLRGRVAFRATFHDGNPSSKIEFPVLEGGKLELAVRSDRGMGGENNQVVWGDPVLLK